jgi:hypothetical protein
MSEEEEADEFFKKRLDPKKLQRLDLNAELFGSKFPMSPPSKKKKNPQVEPDERREKLPPKKPTSLIHTAIRTAKLVRGGTEPVQTSPLRLPSPVSTPSPPSSPDLLVAVPVAAPPVPPITRGGKRSYDIPWSREDHQERETEDANEELGIVRREEERERVRFNEESHEYSLLGSDGVTWHRVHLSASSVWKFYDALPSAKEFETDFKSGFGYSGKYVSRLVTYLPEYLYQYIVEYVWEESFMKQLMEIQTLAKDPSQKTKYEAELFKFSYDKHHRFGRVVKEIHKKRGDAEPTNPYHVLGCLALQKLENWLLECWNQPDKRPLGMINYTAPEFFYNILGVLVGLRYGQVLDFYLKRFEISCYPLYAMATDYLDKKRLNVVKSMSTQDVIDHLVGRASKDGSDVHLHLEEYLKNGSPSVSCCREDEFNCRWFIEEYVERHLGGRAAYINDLSEVALLSHKYQIGAKMDAVFLTGDQQLTVFDWKRSDGLLKNMPPFNSEELRPLTDCPHGRLYIPKNKVMCPSWDLWKYAFQLGVYRKILKLRGHDVSDTAYLVLFIQRYPGYTLIELDLNHYTTERKKGEGQFTVLEHVDRAFQYWYSIVETVRKKWEEKTHKKTKY